MNIEDIRKEMTKEEFIKCIYEDDIKYKEQESDFHYKNHVIGCPCQIGLPQLNEYDCYDDGDCYVCWMNSIKNIKFKGEDEMVKDYDREYDIKEVFEFPEGTEFITDKNTLIKIKNKYGKKVLVLSDENKELYLTEIGVKAKFKLVKKDKEVTFLEAIKANGKTIYSVRLNKTINEAYKHEYEIEGEYSILKDERGYAPTPEEILKSKWFIKEE